MRLWTLRSARGHATTQHNRHCSRVAIYKIVAHLLSLSNRTPALCASNPSISTSPFSPLCPLPFALFSAAGASRGSFSRSVTSLMTTQGDSEVARLMEPGTGYAEGMRAERARGHVARCMGRGTSSGRRNKAG